MKWALVAAGIVVLANGVTIGQAARARGPAPVRLATVTVCARRVIGGPGSDIAPALHLDFTVDTLAPPDGLEAEGLRALGFGAQEIASIGAPPDSGYRPRPVRPAWLRLRQGSDSLRRLVVAEVRPALAALAPDTGSIVLRGSVGIRYRWVPPDRAAGGHDHGGGAAVRPGVMAATVVELFPARLHLNRAQVRALQALPNDSTTCGGERRVTIAGATGGALWVVR